ncbi:MAG: methylthioribulose 1-phosphate dehydratase [Candidatus Acidiferrales bacterium]
MSDSLQEAAEKLARLGRACYARGWVLGTSGNFSIVLSRDPLRLAITPSGADKGNLPPAQVLEIDSNASVITGTGRPSAEVALHLLLVRARNAGAVLHTHSIWTTFLSDCHAADGSLALEGFEMLKGLRGVHTHEHREVLPIVANRQDLPALAAEAEQLLLRHPAAHGFLIHRHGLYTWGDDFEEARRHLEVLEFLFEVAGRGRTGGSDAPVGR